MAGWLVQVPVKRFGTEATVHVYAVWLPDHTDALAAVEKRVEAPSEVPELLIELADGAMAGLGLSRGEVCRICAKS
jgi:hypothetical protein